MFIMGIQSCEIEAAVDRCKPLNVDYVVHNYSRAGTADRLKPQEFPEECYALFDL